MRILGREGFTEGQGDRYRHCHICGPVKYRAIIHFDSGSVEPTVGETVTGATSTNTGVIEYVQLTEGAYADGDAVGVIVLTSPSGYNANTSRIFSDDEALNGSAAGDDFATVKGQPGVTVSGRLHPDWNLVEYRGIYYCRDHFRWYFKQEWQDEAKPDINENERGK